MMKMITEGGRNDKSNDQKCCIEMGLAMAVRRSRTAFGDGLCIHTIRFKCARNESFDTNTSRVPAPA